ncbi:thiamine-phosphate kinase [Thalassotalea sp. LPB0316]|uniref:thiamine-phosphate kinase n=1 Tax=Thalassotalea sp. LPB0316 TaxID=2769490 RepID=UPI00186816DC|nr:thiamine-phosphate kinase [Thalassotalea sp. LPB0316]QOL24396.1 thiamine-phosphate kinase [Thalassotalea sp. LPB0316]
MKEFELIKRYFTEQVVKRKEVTLGIGDDCALILPPQNQEIAITTDTLVSGVHFPENTSPRAIGHKAIAVNLSDLAAMGAEPSWVSIAITLPTIDQAWVEEFCQGVFELCEYFNVQLIGGDTTQGPLSITVTAQGLCPEGNALKRSGAAPGQWIYVTGQIGDAALALKHIKGEVVIEPAFRESILERLEYPKPRVLAGQTIRLYASAAIDISDGLLADLTHICEQSNVGANIVLENIPLSKGMLATMGDEAANLALNGGDDYELLFVVAEANKGGMETALQQLGIPFSCIGQTNHTNKVTTTINEQAIDIKSAGFEHFS